MNQFSSTYSSFGVMPFWCDKSNHLGNVLEVISDRKWGIDDGVYDQTTGAKTSSTPNGTADYYMADIVSYSDFDPFGTMQDQRHGEATQASKYNAGFQGQRTDDEIKGDGNSVDYKYRMHDPRIGRFFAIDPLAPQYAHNSPYAFSENNVIHCVELEGLEKSPVADATYDYFKGMLTNIFDVDPFNVALIGMKLGSGDTEGAKETAKESFTTLIGVPGNSAFKSGVCIANGDSYGAKYYGTTSFLELVTVIASMRFMPEVIIKPKRALIENKLPISTSGKVKGKITNGEFKMEGKAKAQGEFDFVVTAEGEVIIGNKHSFLSKGESVQAAGTMKVRNGNVVRVDNNSGHYQPNLAQSYQMLDILKENGVNTSKATLKVYNEKGKVVKEVKPTN